MSVIILLLIASISVATLFLGAFLWGAKNGQFSDDYAPPRRILFDDMPPERNQEPPKWEQEPRRQKQEPRRRKQGPPAGAGSTSENTHSSI